jgi:hypothetical protein
LVDEFGRIEPGRQGAHRPTHLADGRAG